MEKNEILLIYGDEIQAMASKLVREAGLADLIGDRKKRIGLKPNLVVSRSADGGATTHPEIARGIVKYLQEQGFGNIVILEGSWVGDSTSEAFSRCGYAALAKECGVELIDTQKDTCHTRDCKGMQIEICDSALAVDFMINLPVMKGHCQTRITCALKNNKGIISNREKRRFHTLGLHKPIAHLNTVAKNDFILVDGICGDPDFEEGGNPVSAGRLYAARDPVLCDAWTAVQMGCAVTEVPYIGLSEKLGVGSGDLSKVTVRELSQPKDAALAGNRKPSGIVRRYAEYINEDQACSACYAALIFALSRLDSGVLKKLPGKICIGQGFRGKSGRAGVGRCTADFSASVPGCPPKGTEIIELLRRLK
jgi:uncharacterized protein (DUF362 family)